MISKYPTLLDRDDDDDSVDDGDDYDNIHFTVQMLGKHLHPPHLTYRTN